MSLDSHYIVGNIVVEGNCGGLIAAADVCKKALQSDKVRGAVQHNGNRVRWTTLQQFERHNGFTRRAQK